MDAVSGCGYSTPDVMCSVYNVIDSKDGTKTFSSIEITTSGLYIFVVMMHT